MIINRKSEGNISKRRVRIVYIEIIENKNENALELILVIISRKQHSEIDNKKNFKLATFGQTAWTGQKLKR